MFLYAFIYIYRFPRIGMRKISELRLALVGCGALGSAVLQLIGRLGFGEVHIIDGDIVTESNLRTQMLFEIGDTKIINYKADLAKNKLEDINSETRFQSSPFYLTEKNAEETLKGSDIVIDATDNTKTRLTVNKVCVLKGIPLIEVMAKKKEAMVHMVSGENACFNCLYSASKMIDDECASIDPSLPPISAGVTLNMLLSFLNGDIAPKTVLISADGLNVSRLKIKRLETCEVCSKRRDIKVKEDGFIQVCGGGIKFSFSRRVMLHDVYSKLAGYGELEGDNNYIILRNPGRSVLISDYGDLLFTGYGLEEAKKFIESIKPIILVSQPSP
ncbi:MAG: HesA/MoeB/ThiF family protein [Candidatus Acidifodinimicrobium sp.]